MDLSYKKVRDKVNSLDQLCKSPIVQVHSGGAKGGETVVTPAGIELMEAFQGLQSNFNRFLEEQWPHFWGK